MALPNGITSNVLEVAVEVDAILRAMPLLEDDAYLRHEAMELLFESPRSVDASASAARLAYEACESLLPDAAFDEAVRRMRATWTHAPWLG